MSRRDKHSLANIEDILCSSIDLHLTADFENQALIGYVEFQAQVLQNTTAFVLDSKALMIRHAMIDGEDCCTTFYCCYVFI